MAQKAVMHRAAIPPLVGLIGQQQKQNALPHNNCNHRSADHFGADVYFCSSRSYFASRARSAFVSICDWMIFVVCTLCAIERSVQCEFAAHRHLYGISDTAATFTPQNQLQIFSLTRWHCCRWQQSRHRSEAATYSHFNFVRSQNRHAISTEYILVHFLLLFICNAAHWPANDFE